MNATESVEMAGVVPGLLVPSTVATTSFNAGNAGKVIINTSRMLLRDGGAVSSNTLATGNAGALTINARESVEISGKVPGSPLPSAVRSSAPIVPYSLQQVYGLAPVPSGASGDVTINTGRLSVTDGAKVDVSNQGVGKAGILQVNANSVFLDTQGSITAATASGEGGNIELNVPDVLLLRNNSPITASAGGTGNGGNITIDSLFIVATSPTGKNGSDITANAGQGNGGAIGITTQGLFGIEFRPHLTPHSDITVSSQFGLSGTYELNSPNIDPSRGLLNLPNQFVDVSRQMRQNCPARGTGQENRFVVTGTGGLPP
ncbi:MAG: filamentous hemagglutinin, partial [Coleofasciculus sp. C2-GNP5-27]